jgi:hypothetical protein
MSSDYKFSWPFESLSIEGIISPACFKDLTAMMTLESTISAPSGLQVHNAWHISWASSDRSTLTPTPPALSYSESIKTWVPGETVAKTTCSDTYNGGVNYDVSLLFFLVIGLPIIALALLISCCTYCICARRKLRRARSSASGQG